MPRRFIPSGRRRKNPDRAKARLLLRAKIVDAMDKSRLAKEHVKMMRAQLRSL